MAYETLIQLSGIALSGLAALIVFFTMWDGKFGILNTLYSAAGAVLTLAVLLVVAKFVVGKIIQQQQGL